MVLSASQEIHKQFHHFESSQDATNSNTFFHRELKPFKSLNDHSGVQNNDGYNNSNEKSQNDDMDEARHNLVTRIMSNGVEVIIASDKTKMPDSILADKPTTFAASTVKNQMILLLPLSTTSTYNSHLVNQSTQLNFNLPIHSNYFITKTCLTTYTYHTTYVQDGHTTVESRQKVISNIATEERNYSKIIPTQTIGVTLTKLNFNLPIHSNYFITKTCLTTYTYHTTYVQDGHTTVESRQKVISNIATEERNYSKIIPTQTIGVTLTKTPELAVEKFPTTYSYFNTFKDNRDKLKVMTSEYTIVNTITGPNDYFAHLQPTVKATPVIKTNTYFNEVTFSHKFKSHMYTLKRNITQVVITKSYTSRHSVSLKTSSYAYEDNSKDLLRTAVISHGAATESENFTEYKTKSIDDIHIYATKIFSTTFTYYTTTVLNTYLLDSFQTGLHVTPLSTVFNYYTRVIENIITDSVPASLLSNDLITKMKIKLKKQKPNQSRRFIVTTATLKDGQTVEISAMELNSGTSVSFTPTPSLDTAVPFSETVKESLNHAQEKSEIHYLHQGYNDEVNKISQTQQISNAALLNTVKYLENQEVEETSNDIASLESEQIVSVIERPDKHTSGASIPTFIIEKPSTTAANQLIQRLTALKPMFNAMADLFQSNFGVSRENVVNTIKKIKSNQTSQANTKFSSATDFIGEANHPIYIPVDQSPLNQNTYDKSNFTKFMPQSLHIKPPLLENDEHNFEMNRENKISIIPMSDLTAPRNEQPLHNGGIYIRPGEIITANSDVIIGKPNGIEYVQIPNQLNMDNNISKAYSPVQQFQVTYYYNKVQHPYIKESSMAQFPPITHKPAHVSIVNHTLRPHATFGLRPPNEQYFNKNILKPPPLPPATSTAFTSAHAEQGLSLMLKVPKMPPRIRNKQQTATNTHLLHESTSSTFQLLDSSMDKLPNSSSSPSIGKLNFYNANNELKNNEISEIEQTPQLSSNLKQSSIKNSYLQNQSDLSAFHLETDNVQTEKEVLSSEYLPKYVAISNWKNNLQPAMKLQNGRQPQLNQQFSPHITDSMPKPITTSIDSPTKKIFYNVFQSSPDIQNLSLKLSTKPITNKVMQISKQSTKYSSETANKNLQNVSLDQHIFSQTVDVNVPPLTFHDEDHDYPQQPVTAVRGQIPPTTVKKIHRLVGSAYKYMPLISIPANEQQVQVNLTPSNSLSAFPLRNEQSWKSKTANSDTNNNLPKSNNFNIKHQTGPSSRTQQYHNRQQIPQLHSHLSNKLQMLTTTKIAATEEIKINTEKIFITNQNQHQQQTKAEEIADIVASKTTTHPSFEVTSDLRYHSSRLNQPQSLTNENLRKMVNQVHHAAVNSSVWSVMQNNNSKNEHREISGGQYRPTRTSIQKSNNNNPPPRAPTNPTTTVATAAKASRHVTTTKPTPEDIHVLNSTTKNAEPKHVNQIVTHGEPFRKVHQQNNEDIFVKKHNSNITAAILIGPGAGFRTSTSTHNVNDKIIIKQVEHRPTMASRSTVQLLSANDIFASGENLYPIKHIQEILPNVTIFPDVLTKSVIINSNAATTEDVLGLHPPPLIKSTNLNTAYKTVKPSYSLSKSGEKTYNMTKQLVFNNTYDISLGKQIKVPNNNISEVTNKASSEHFVNSENDEFNDSFILTNLQPSKTYEAKVLGKTSISTQSSAATTTMTTKNKHIILPTKYMSDKGIYTLTTTSYVPSSLSPLFSSNYVESSSYPSATDATNEVTNLFFTHTQINTSVGIAISVKTLESLRVTTTATIKPFSTLKQFTTMYTTHSSILPQRNSSIAKIEQQMAEINQNITYLPYPSVEVVSTNITHELPGHNTNENSIFIIMTDNKNKKNYVFNRNQLSSSPVAAEIFDDNNNLPIDETSEIMIEYDNSVSFDNVHIREEEPLHTVNGKSAESSAFINNVASVKESSSENHVVFGGVLIATPPQISTKHQELNESVKALSCHPKCKASRNEQCALVETHWSCSCRPGFARMFPDRPCKPTYTYDLLMHAERVGNYALQYISELTNNKTDHYKHLSQVVNNALDRMIMQSDFRDVYHGVEITQFVKGHTNNPHGLLISILLQLSDNSNEKRLEEVLKKNLRLSNYSIGGTDLYTNKAGVDDLSIKDFNECLSRKLNDCSQNSHCFNLPGTYTCSCVEGFVDLSDNSIYPGRICSSEQIGCEICHYHGKCSNLLTNSNDRNLCECFPWYAGSKCQINLKILLIVLLGICTLLFILLLFCILITCTKRRNYLQHIALTPSTVTSSSEGMQKNSRLAANMEIATVGLRSSLQTLRLKNNKHQKTMKIDKRSMIKDSSSEASQNSLPYILKNKKTTAGSSTKRRLCILNHSKKYQNYKSAVNKITQCPVPLPTNIPSESQSNLNTIITTSSSYKSNDQKMEHQILLENDNEYEGNYCEQSDRSLTVMIPRAKYRSSVLSQTQLMHHQLTMERIHKTAKYEKKMLNADKEMESKLIVKRNASFTKETRNEEKSAGIFSNTGALISAGFEVSAIVRDNTVLLNSAEQHNDLFSVDSVPPSYAITTTSEPATSLDSIPGKTSTQWRKETICN